jgi:hypothetical protein
VRVGAHPTLGVWDPDLAKQSEPLLRGLLATDPTQPPYRVGDLVADREDRVQAATRMLRNEPDATAAESFALLRTGHVVAVEPVGVHLDAGARVDKTQHRARRHALACAGLADEPQDFPAPHFQVHAPENRQRGLRAVELDAQAGQLDERSAVARHVNSRLRGSTASAMTSPSRLKVNTVMTIARPGKNDIHH